EMISISGLLHVESIDNISKAYNYSKLTEEARHSLSGQALRDSFQSRPVRICFLGCWDAVGAKGTPIIGLQPISRLWTEYHSGKLCENIDVACQALALDETNPAFDPHIWTGIRSSNFKKLEQVWFAGSHANVTGGQRDSRLSDIAFRWLLNKASKEGLKFDAEKVEDLSTPDPMGCIAETPKLSQFTKWFSKRHYLRPVGIADTFLSREQIPGTEKIHTSIHKREQTDSSYSPLALSNLPPGTLPVCESEDVPKLSNRRYDRLQVNCPATLLVNSSRFNGNLLDYSSGGARIWMPLDLPVGTEITLRSSVLFDAEKAGRVVWVKDQSLGLKFTGETSLNDLQMPPHQTLQ
ncbi:MAG: DUF2235 domain-containing protein, partial [Sneathiella sp.]|nr:DUF2235 domain-containing protein [Sneathiella sp.]